jgi:hypothetical protein
VLLPQLRAELRKRARSKMTEREREEIKAARVVEEQRLLEQVDQPHLTASTIVAQEQPWPEAHKMGRRGKTK